MKIVEFLVQGTSYIFSLCTSAVKGATLHMKPTSARNLCSILPLQFSLFRRNVS